MNENQLLNPEPIVFKIPKTKKIIIYVVKEKFNYESFTAANFKGLNPANEDKFAFEKKWCGGYYDGPRFFIREVYDDEFVKNYLGDNIIITDLVCYSRENLSCVYLEYLCDYDHHYEIKWPDIVLISSATMMFSEEVNVKRFDTLLECFEYHATLN